MGSPPLSALQVRPPDQPPDLIGQVGKTIQLSSLLQAQPLQQQALQQQVTAGAQENQLRDMDIKSRQALQDAGKGLDWTQPDTFGKFLTNAQQNGAAPQVLSQLATQRAAYNEQVAKTDTATLTAEQTRSNLLLGHIDAIKGVDDPAKRAQIAQSQASQILNLGLVKDPNSLQMVQAMAQGQKVPTDDELKQYEIGLTDHKTQVEQALKQREVAAAELTAGAKAQGAATSAAEFQSKIDPSSPLYDPSAAYLAKRAAAGDPEARSIFAQQVQQAGAKAGAEASAKLPYEVQAEVAKQTALQQMNPAAVAGVAPHLVGPATNAYAKAGEEYATAYQSAQNMQDFLNQARAGNKEAIKIVPLQGALEITTAQGVHRINRTEVDQFGGAGNLYDKLAGKVGGMLTGKDITDSVLTDMDAVQKTVSQNASLLHANKVATINASYGSKFQPMQFGAGTSQATSAPSGPPAGATHTAPGSDGKMHFTNKQGQDLGIVPGQ